MDDAELINKTKILRNEYHIYNDHKCLMIAHSQILRKNGYKILYTFHKQGVIIWFRTIKQTHIAKNVKQNRLTSVWQNSDCFGKCLPVK